MVGVPRSTGCSICVKRRIKCDEGRPQCENCLKYGATCPGYDHRFRFVTGKTYRTANVRPASSTKAKSASPVDLEGRKLSPYSGVSSSPSVCFSWNPQQSGEPSPTQAAHHVLDAYGAISQDESEPQRSNASQDLVVTLPAAISPHKQYQLQLVTSLCENLPTPKDQREIQVMSGYLRHLPDRFGNSKALDAAVLAFATQQIGTTFSDTQMIRSGRDSYVRALALLQKSLNDSGEAFKSETHATAYLLCTYELFAGTTSHKSWMKHAAGLAKLVQCRGPEEFRTEFDVALLRSCRGIIIMDCMFNGKDVFLKDRAWREAMREFSSTSPDPGFQNFFEDFHDLLAEVPDVLRRGYDLREAYRLGKPLPLNEEEILELIWNATELYGKFQVWYAQLEGTLPFPQETPSATKDQLFPIVYDFKTYSAGGLYISYWACMLILQTILQTCGCLPEDAISPNELVNRICKSVEWNAHGIWGGFRLGFALRIAFEVATPEVKEWLAEWHVKLSKTYAAVGVQSLPEDPAVDRLRTHMATLMS